VLKEEGGVIWQKGSANDQERLAEANPRLTVDEGVVLAVGIVVGAVEPLVGITALTRIGLAHIRLVT
jgi:hypothetical protein